MTEHPLTMTKAIILSAGQGSRLLPLTENKPKCMLTVAGRTVLEWQLDALVSVGINEITIVTGFHSKDVEKLLNSNYAQHPGIKVLYNPFFNVSDNLTSCWLARTSMDTDFLLINGDTIFEVAVLEHVLASPPAPIILTTDQKPSYDEDDMKVQLDGQQVKQVSKTLLIEQTNAESIGMLFFRENGPSIFKTSLEDAMKTPDGLKSWFLSVVDRLAKEEMVQCCFVTGLKWAEIDFIADLEFAEKLLAE